MPCKLESGSIFTTTGPYFANVTLLMHMNGTNGSSTFTDEKGNTVTVVNATLSTATFKYGTASASFNGTNTYASVPDSDALDMGSSDFTIEFWMKGNSRSGAGQAGGLVTKGFGGTGSYSWSV